MNPSGYARLGGALAALTLSASLSGCITLFPPEKPVPLYRFDAQAAPFQGGGRPFTVRITSDDFDPAAAGDRIMTVDGTTIAYLTPGRWESPASELFEAAIAHGLSTAGGPARLVGTGTKTEYRLNLAVSRFEARYTSGPTSAPTIEIAVHASLERQSDLSTVAAQDFTAEAPASDNRVGPMVDAYNQAATKVVSDLVAWVNEKGR